MALALSGAFVVMGNSHAQTHISASVSDQSLASGNYVIDSGVTISSSTGSIAVTSPGTATLTNNGVIDGSVTNGIGLSNLGNLVTLTNGSNALISGVDTAIHNEWSNTPGLGTIGTLTNKGTILSSSGAAIDNQGTIGTLLNAGAASGSAAGTISAAGRYAINNGGSIGSLINDGLIVNTSIAGNRYAIDNEGTIGTLSNSGTIQGYNGIKNNDSITLLSNTGTISATGGVGLDNGGTIATLINTGTISGNAGISSGGTINSLQNSGLISGVSVAIFGGTIGTLANSGTIAGTIFLDGTDQVTITGGSGTVFGTLTGQNGSIGSITSFGDLRFGSGNQLLNDNITVGISSSGTVTNAGTLQVNNPVTISGNYVQGSGATLIIGVVSDGTNNAGNILDAGYGRLVVVGNATLDGSTITVKAAGYGLAQGQRYVVVAAQGSLSATGVTYSASGYRVTGTIENDSSNSNYKDLVLEIGQGGAINNASNPRSAAALQGLFNYSGHDASLLAVFNPAAVLTDPAAANRAGAQLSPAATANAVVAASGAAFGAVQSAAGARLDGVRVAQAGGGNGSGVATGESTLAPAVWGRLFGGLANQAQRDGISGYHASYGGLMLGSDVQVRDDWRVGGLVSYARTNVGSEGDNTGSSASVNSVGLTAYAGYTGNPWYVNLTAGVARQSYSTTRAVNFTGFSGVANGSFNGTLYTTTAEAGYPLAIGDAVLTPLAGLRYSTLRQDGYTESGGNGAALTVNGSTSSSLKSEIGAKFERSVTTSYGELKPFVRLGWNHEFRSTPLTTVASFAADTTGTTAFTAQGASPLRNTAALSLGATLLQSKNLTLSARYTLEGARGYTAQTGDLTLRWQY